MKTTGTDSLLAKYGYEMEKFIFYSLTSKYRFSLLAPYIFLLEAVGRSC